MKLQSLDLNLLATLEILLEECSVSRAALRLGVSQAAVSVQLAKLRAHFDDSLFIPSGRGVVATAFASALADPLRDLMHRARALVSTRQTFDSLTARRRFRVRAGDIDTFLLLSAANRRLLAEAPGIAMTVAGAQTDFQKVDFHITPYGLHHADLRTVDLYHDHYVCLASADHPKIGRTLTEKQYFDAVHIVRRSGVTGAPSLEAQQMKKMGRVRVEGPVVENYGSIPFLLIGSPYLTTVPSRYAEEMARLFPLKILKLPFAFASQTLVLQWDAVLDEDMAALWFRKLMHEVADGIYAPKGKSPRDGAAGAPAAARAARRGG